MKRIIPILFLCLWGCASTKTITVLDAKTDQPVPNLELVEYKGKKPFFIVTEVKIKNRYTTDENGQVKIRGNHFLQPELAEYTIWDAVCSEKQNRVDSSILYVTKQN